VYCVLSLLCGNFASVDETVPTRSCQVYQWLLGYFLSMTITLCSTNRVGYRIWLLLLVLLEQQQLKANNNWVRKQKQGSVLCRGRPKIVGVKICCYSGHIQTSPKDCSYQQIKATTIHQNRGKSPSFPLCPLFECQPTDRTGSDTHLLTFLSFHFFLLEDRLPWKVYRVKLE